MDVSIVLLRGLNVGGHGQLPMKDLVRILASVGCRDVVTYLQSGNAVCGHEATAPGDLARRIREAVRADRGLDCEVFVLRREELAAAIAGNPFPSAEAAPQTLHLTFLARVPPDPDLDALAAVKTASERFALRDAVFYLHAPDGIGRSKLAARVEKALGVPGTSRNWRTATKLRELADATASGSRR